MAENRLLTYDDLASFPDDGLRRELLGGELVVTPAPRLRHQDIVGRLHLELGGLVKQRGGGRVYLAPTDVILSIHDVVEPDLIFVDQTQIEILTEKNIQGVPALLIEVLSDARTDRVRKRDVYASFGVPEYWIVDPEADRVEIYRLDGDHYGKPEILEPGDMLTFPALPDLAISVTELLER